MLKKGLIIEFYDGQNQFKVPFMMYEAILNPMQGPSPDSSEPYIKEVNQHIPSGFCVYSNKNKINDPILNLTPENITQRSGIE